MEAKDWKDTVMSDEQLDDIGYPILPIGDRTGSRRVAQAQAKVSFEAGKQEGRREVVEWLKKNDTLYIKAIGDQAFAISRDEWQTYLKEWGL